MPPFGICRLCGQESKIVESHIIPKFVSDWLKSTSANGFFRSSQIVNRRLQDGMKEHMLCLTCESMLNKWETQVANNIFYPHSRGERDYFEYGAWLLKYAVSISWRSLTHYIDNSKDEIEYSDSALKWIDKALISWKEFLFDKRPHPGSFEQHLILVNILKSVSNTEHLAPNLNRYLTRIQEINLAHNDGDPLFIYTKMGKMI